MTAEGLVAKVIITGGGFKVKGSSLEYNIAEKIYSENLKEEIRKYKAEIIRIIQPLPYIDFKNDLVIPFASDPKYHYWKEDGMKLTEIEKEARERNKERMK